MELSDPQHDIYWSEARFRVVVAGRRFGKTYLSTTELLRHAAKGKNRNVWYVAPTYKAAKDIAWDMLKDGVPKGWVKKTNESDLSMRLKNGSVISLRGAEKPDNLRGRALDFIVLDEFADMKPETWHEVLRASLSDRQGKALFIGTPRGRNHFYDLWVQDLEDWESFQFTTLEGGNVPEYEVEAAKRDLDERTFKQEYEAAFVNYSGIIYYNFDRLESVKASAEEASVLHVGMDFNLDPMSAVVAVREGNSLHVVDELVIYGSNTDEMVDELKVRYQNKKLVIYPDPACRQRKTSAGGRTDLSILQNAGFAVKVRERHTSVRDRINSVNARLKTSDGERHLFIDPKCRQAIKSLERQTYKEGTSQPDKESGYDHMNDALGYLVDYLYPIKRKHDLPKQTRWS